MSTSTSSPRIAASSKVGASGIESCRFAPAKAQANGIPAASTMIDHLWSSLPRLVGFGPVPYPPAGLL